MEDEDLTGSNLVPATSLKYKTNTKDWEKLEFNNVFI